mmetsp:Transcript_7006/g.9106  ORF Transcript_7006/g.9106 Transcript_7006/m.9106 type:complete len:332 (+) Transcript_7006:255-1250(+)
MNNPELVVFGYDFTKYSKATKLAGLTAGVLCCSLSFAYLQEKVTRTPSFSQYELMTLLTTLTFALCGVLERMQTQDLVRKGPLVDYAKLSLFTLGGMLFTNWSLAHISYTTRIVFKSSKVIPVMIVGMIMQGRRYSKLEYVSVLMLVAGIVLFTLGDSGDKILEDESQEYDFTGIALISIGVICDAITSNFEEKRFFHGHNCSPAEVMTYASAFGCLTAFATLVLNGSMFHSLEYILESPAEVLCIILFSALGYMSTVFILLLIKTFGATNAEIVKSMRKILSIVISFLAFAKPFTSLHFYGFLAFAISSFIGIRIKYQKIRKEKASTSQL